MVRVRVRVRVRVSENDKGGDENPGAQSRVTRRKLNMEVSGDQLLS